MPEEEEPEEPEEPEVPEEEEPEVPDEPEELPCSATSSVFAVSNSTRKFASPSLPPLSSSLLCRIFLVPESFMLLFLSTRFSCGIVAHSKSSVTGCAVGVKPPVSQKPPYSSNQHRTWCVSPCAPPPTAAAA